MIATKETAEEQKNDRVWKALADPTRRQLMDLIRTAPQTTGDLANEFESIGRCAIMKHLSILEESRLIVTEKKGKFKWNYINAHPLQEIHERWVKKYEAQWASSLLQLKELAEFKSNINHITQNLIMEQQSKTIQILQETLINANISEVWNSLTTEINLWWRKDFYTSTKTKEFILEPKVGGKMYEDYGNDEGLQWAEVIVVDSPNVIEMKGHLSPQYGGPAISFLKLSLKEDGAGTILTLSETLFGAVSDKTKNDQTAGWKMLFEEGFKTYVENK